MRKWIMSVILCMACFFTQAQSSNKGKDFWVAYPLNYYFVSGEVQAGPSNQQEMVLYLNATEPAIVKITGNSGPNQWTKTYNIAANSVVATSTIPKSGITDSRLCADDVQSTFATSEKVYDRGIHIESDVPVVAYAHVYSPTNSGAAMLLPVETWGYNYISLNSSQNYSMSRSYLYVMASHDDTRIQITPNVETVSGHAANVPFTVDLNKGQVYQMIANGPNDDLTGSRISSISNTSGKCYPMAVYSGSSRTAICGTSGDFIMQQCFPAQAWGKRYLTTPFRVDNDEITSGVFRILVKEPGTIVKRNGIQLTNLINNTYYEFLSSTSDYIESDQPIMVAQYMTSMGDNCGALGPVATPDNANGDPEMIYLSPIEQSINKIGFYKNNKLSITLINLCIIIPTAGVSSLLIDGVRGDYDMRFDHPNLPGYTVILKRYPPLPGQSFAQSDSAFTAITYGVGGDESYGYNAGTLVKNLITAVELSNEHDSTTLYSATCIDTRTQFVLKTEYQPVRIDWDLTGIPELASNGIISVSNPVSYSTVQENKRTYYLYKLPNYFYLKKEGTYIIPVTITTPEIESCSNSQTMQSAITVKTYPTTDFSYTFAGCLSDAVKFKELTPAASGLVEAWTWVTDNNTLNIKDAEYIYNTPGKHDVLLKVGLKGGCTADTLKVITLPDVSPVAAFDLPSNVCMPYGAAVFTNKSTNPSNPAATLTYEWKFGEGGSSTLKSPEYRYKDIKDYEVQLITRAPNGCMDTAVNILSSFIDRPKAVFAVTDPEICAREIVAFTETSSAAAGASLTDWFWQLGNGKTAIGQSAPLKYEDGGDFTISLHVKDNRGCLSDTVSDKIKVYAIPYVQAGDDQVMVKGTPVTLKAEVRGATEGFQWSPAALLSDGTILNPLSLATADQLYYLTANGGNGCNAYDSVLVKVVDLIKVPNAFSPNGDGINDVWRIPGLEGYINSSVQVFNRWGQKVYESKGYPVPWNGRINGKTIPVGTYYYIIKPNHPRVLPMNGTITIIY